MKFRIKTVETQDGQKHFPQVKFGFFRPWRNIIVSNHNGYTHFVSAKELIKKYKKKVDFSFTNIEYTRIR